MVVLWMGMGTVGEHLVEWQLVNQGSNNESYKPKAPRLKLSERLVGSFLEVRDVAIRTQM